MNVEKQISLLPYNTFGMDVYAEEFVNATSVEELTEATIESSRLGQPLFILGGGSNVLLRSDVQGRTVLNGIEGVEVIEDNLNDIIVRVGAGEVWHDFVLWAIDNNYAGIENMSLIPGSVGASPMQNIGAYGAELKDVFYALEAVDVSSGKVKRFTASECEFGYRTSIFKTHAKGQFAISYVEFRLSKTPQFNTSYGAIEAELESMGVQELSLRAVSDAVINIRSSKLPDPKEIGNAGSFFKNPVVDIDLYEKVKAENPNAPGYTAGEGKMKIAAGWLIEQAGWKGKTLDNFGVHKKQALVLVNYGGASGEAIYQLSSDIKADVYSKFGVDLEREVNIM